MKNVSGNSVKYIDGIQAPRANKPRPIQVSLPLEDNTTVPVRSQSTKATKNHKPATHQSPEW